MNSKDIITNLLSGGACLTVKQICSITGLRSFCVHTALRRLRFDGLIGRGLAELEPGDLSQPKEKAYWIIGKHKDEFQPEHASAFEVGAYWGRRLAA